MADQKGKEAETTVLCLTGDFGTGQGSGGNTVSLKAKFRTRTQENNLQELDRLETQQTRQFPEKTPECLAGVTKIGRHGGCYLENASQDAHVYAKSSRITLIL